MPVAGAAAENAPATAPVWDAPACAAILVASIDGVPLYPTIAVAVSVKFPPAVTDGAPVVAVLVMLELTVAKLLGRLANASNEHEVIPSVASFMRILTFRAALA